MTIPPASSHNPIVRSTLRKRRLFTCILFIALIFFSIAVGHAGFCRTGVFAAFSADPMSGIAPLEVHFTDTSTGAYAWTWVF